MRRISCPYDLAYLLDHPTLIGWKKCPGCGYAEDPYGQNLLNKEVNMISMDEVLKGRAKLEDLDQETQKNLNELLVRINKLRAAYGKPLKVNDGYRRPQDTPKNGAAKSKHLLGQAIDLDDDDSGTFWFWLMKPEQMKLLKEIGLWLEHGNYTHNKKYGTWVHIQIVPPNSGRRIFVPSTEPDPNPKFWSGKYDEKYN